MVAAPSGAAIFLSTRGIAMAKKTVAQLGILILETRFPRILGDIGNPATWPFPILYKTVSGASSHRVVHEQGRGLIAPFLQAARELEAEGADGIATSCGFLSLFQAELAAHVGVPVATSSLLQIPLVERLLPAGRRVGIITISAGSLSADHLQCAGVDPATPVAGTDGGLEFSRAILGDAPTLNFEAARQDILDAGDSLLQNYSNIGAVVLECTNMAPYARALSAHLHLPVYDIVSFLTWFQAGLLPRAFAR
jgi:Asp/Glu/hydantoin racemase